MVPDEYQLLLRITYTYKSFHFRYSQNSLHLCLSVVWLWCVLAWICEFILLGIHPLRVDYCFSYKFGNFLTIISSNILSSPFLFLTHRSWRFCSFLLLLFSVPHCLNWPIYQVHWLFGLLKSSLSFFSEFFISFIMLFNSGIFFTYNFYLFISCIWCDITLIFSFSYFLWLIGYI